jgi:hypothetical protein
MPEVSNSESPNETIVSGLLEQIKFNSKVKEVLKDRFNMGNLHEKEVAATSELRKAAESGSNAEALIAQSGLIAIKLKILQDEEALQTKYEAVDNNRSNFSDAVRRIDETVGATAMEFNALSQIYKAVVARDTGRRYA